MSAPWWDSDGDRWTDTAEWWTDPATAYLAGLVDGARLERERQHQIDEVLWRKAVQRTVRIIEADEARDRREGA